jgi:hypothetical protein
MTTKKEKKFEEEKNKNLQDRKKTLHKETSGESKRK